MITLKILFGIAALILAWALLFRAHMIYSINRWMREYAFSDQWVLFSGRRIAALFFILGCLALFSGIDHVMDQKPIPPAMVQDILQQAQVEFFHGRYTRSIKRCKIVLQSDPANIQARELLAASWIMAGDIEKGQKEIALIFKVKPDYAPTEGPIKNILLKQINNK